MTELDEAREFPENFRYYSADSEWTKLVDWHPPTPAPTTEQYAGAERLLRGRGPLDADAARLRCWIADTKPLAVKAGWNDDAPLIEYPTPLDWQDIIDRVRADLPSPRPSLWQRTPEWAIWLGIVVLIVALLALPVIA